jgi:membrane protein YqaA with SNARE-associated domain
MSDGSGPARAGNEGAEAPPQNRASAVRVAIVVSEAAMVIGLLTVWLVSKKVHTGQSLLVLFLYCFPSEFLIGLIPHEPVLLLYGALHPPVVVALISTVGTVLAERLNYSFLGFFQDVGWFDRMRRRMVVDRLIRLFGRAPFSAILLAGFTPMPFAPIRFLVVLTRYPVAKYMLAVFISRAPRFLILAWLGDVLRFKAWMLVGIFAVLFAALYAPLFRRTPGEE